MQLYRFPFIAMGGPAELQFYYAGNEHAAGLCAESMKAEVLRLETKYTRYRDNSVTSRINQSAGRGQAVRLDEETCSLLNFAAACFKQSDGLFDITAGVLRRVWDFKRNIVPSQQQIDTVLPLIGWDKVIWGPPYIELPLAGMEIDLGGYVKEYAADAAVAVARAQGIAHGVVDLAGDIALIGPHADGRAWRVGVRNPSALAQAVAIVELAEGALATSGDYARCIDINGRRYSHILNPFTGWPAAEAQSVSVLADQCLIGGSVSTMAMLQQQDALDAWLDDIGLPYLRIDHQGHISGTVAPMLSACG